MALKVQLDIGAVKYDLTKDTSGVWTGDSNPQDEGFHYYQLWIDGAAVPDPGSLYFYGAGRWGSGVEVPARDQDFHSLKNVPHGQIREHLYLEDIVPMIDASYRTLADQPHRAMAGLSMGGMETRVITLARPDMFSCVGIFSGGSISVEDIAQSPGFKEKVKLVFVSFGSRELEHRRPDGLFGGDHRAITDSLRQAGINAHLYISPLTAHEWQSWRRSLHEFAQLVFKD